MANENLPAETFAHEVLATLAHLWRAHTLHRTRGREEAVEPILPWMMVSPAGIRSPPPLEYVQPELLEILL